MRISVGPFAVFLLALGGCFNFDAAYEQYCSLKMCPDGGGGGTAGGSGGGGMGGGAGDAGFDAGVRDAGAPVCDAGLCFVRSYDVPKVILQSLWAVSPTEVFAGGERGTIVHFDGTNFIPAKTPGMTGRLWAVHGTSPTNVWAVGTPGGNTNRWDGSGWVPYGNPTGQGSFYGIYALPNGIEAWGTTSANEVMRWDGATWSIAAVQSGGSYFEGIHGCGADEAWIVSSGGNIYRYSSDGGLVTEYVGTTYLNAVFCHPTAGVWAVGQSGLVMVRDNAGNWAVLPLGLTTNLFSVWVSNAGEPWIVGSGRTLVRVVDGGAVPYNRQPYDLANYTDVAGAGDSLWVTGSYPLGALFDGGVMVQYRVGAL